MTDSGLGPREYAVEPEHVPFLKRRNVKVAGSVVLVLAVGGGAFGVAQAFTGSSSPTVSPPTPSANGAVPGGGSSGGSGVGGGAASRIGALRGEITAIGASSFTISTRSGAQVVAVNSKTTFRAASGSSESFSALKVNDFVSVAVEPNVSPPVAASVAVGTAAGGGFGREGFAGGRFGGNLTVGSVTSVGATSFVVASRSFGQGSGPTTTSVTVKVTSATKFQSGTPTAASSASFSDVKKGVDVFVSGAKSGSTVIATMVTIIPAGEFGGRGGGRSGGGFAGGGASSAGSSAGT